MQSYESWIAGGERNPIELGEATRHIFMRTGGAGRRVTLLHGFPTSCFDWHRVWSQLCAERQVLAFDFLGFGDSDKPTLHDYTIHEQADLTERLWARFEIESTAIVAHDYGVSVAQELLARHREGTLRTRVEQVICLNGGLYPELHRAQPAQLALLDPETGPQIGKLMSLETLTLALRPTYAQEPSAEELADAWQSVSRRGGTAIAHRLIRYIRDREQHRDRWVTALETASLPRSFIWGLLDPVSGAHMAERIAVGLPQAEIVRLDDVAHWPQLEAPERVATALLRMLA